MLASTTANDLSQLCTQQCTSTPAILWWFQLTRTGTVSLVQCWCHWRGQDGTSSGTSSRSDTANEPAAATQLPTAQQYSHSHTVLPVMFLDYKTDRWQSIVILLKLVITSSIETTKATLSQQKHAIDVFHNISISISSPLLYFCRIFHNSKWNFRMIHWQQITASLPPSSDDPWIMFM